jgi:hypothetical protein
MIQQAIVFTPSMLEPLLPVDKDGYVAYLLGASDTDRVPVLRAKHVAGQDFACLEGSSFRKCQNMKALIRPKGVWLKMEKYTNA